MSFSTNNHPLRNFSEGEMMFMVKNDISTDIIDPFKLLEAKPISLKYLLEKYNSSFVTPIAEGVLLIFNFIFSVWLLNEKVTKDMIIGVLFIVTGVFMVYCNHLNFTIF